MIYRPIFVCKPISPDALMKDAEPEFVMGWSYNDSEDKWARLDMALLSLGSFLRNQEPE